MANRTLGELLTQLQLRLGFVTTGQAAQHNAPILEGFLTSAHAHVLLELGTAAAAPGTSWLELIEGESYYDFNDDAADHHIDPALIRSLHLYAPAQAAPVQQPGQPPVQPLDEHGPLCHLRRAAYIGAHIRRGQPTHYAHEAGQLRIHPAPDARYRVAIVHHTADQPFTRPHHRTSVPDELVLMHALAVAKSHYRQPDAQIALSIYQGQMARHKAAQHGAVRYFDGAASAAGPRTVERMGAKHVFYL